MPKPSQGNGRYMAGLDGLRAIAVLAVIAYHLNLGWAPGGLLGVGVFFTLSGYLITDILIAQWKQNGRLALKNFWLRRARRLLPAMFTMLAVVVTWITLFDPAQLSTLRGDVPAALLYVSNWWFIFHQVSYFARFGAPSPLNHLWSLAVEEQFYLIWPLLLVFGLRFVRKRGKLTGLILIGAVASAATMALLYQPGMDPSRVYYGTDTRAFGLLIGAALAVLWPSRQLSANVSSRVRLVIDVAGGAGLLTILLMMGITNQYETFLYRGGMLLLAMATAVLVAAIAHPASRLSRILGWKPLRYIGVRSYGIYLWHYPVIVLTSGAVNTGGVDVPRAILQVGLSIGIAELSWRFIEEPIRHGGLKGLWAQLAGAPDWRRGRMPRRFWIASVCTLLMLGVSGVGMAKLTPAMSTSFDTNSISRPRSSLAPVQSHTTSQNETVSGSPNGSNGSIGSNKSNGTNTSNGSNTSTLVTQPNQPHPPVPVTATKASGQGITAIGDSIMVDAAPYLQKQLPGIVVDGQIGRQMYQAQAAVNQLKAKGELGTRVIIELGTNGPFTQNQLLSLLRSLGPVQQIVLVNTRVPRPWQTVVNATLAQVAATFPHTTLADWYTASAGHNGYFYPDGVHLDPLGSRSFTALLAKAVRQ